MHDRTVRNSRSERGQSLVTFTFLLAVICGFVAMSIDVGMIFTERRDRQNAADASALAAADVLLEGGTTGEAVAAAQSISLANGYDDAAADVTVTVNIPPASGPYQGDPDFTEVIIQEPVPAVFASVLGIVSWDVSARAVASMHPESKPYSIIALDSNACKAMQFSGQVSVTIAGAGTLTNADCFPNAFYAEGSVNVVDSVNDVVGGWAMSGNSYNISPDPSRVGHYADPLADVPEPTPVDTPVQDCPTYGGAAGTKTLEPGVYNCTIDPPGAWGLTFMPGDYYITGGIVIDGSGGPVTFGSGLYYLEGQGLLVTGSSDVSGDGVTFFIKQGQAVLTGSGVFNLDAPTNGTYEGVVIFQARDLTSTVELTGNSVSDGWGTVYAAGAQIHVTGNGATSYQFIGNTFLTDGDTNLNITFNDGFLATVPAVRLVE